MIKLIATGVIPITLGICLFAAFIVLVLQIAKEIVNFKKFLKENDLFIALLYPFCLVIVLFFMFTFFPVCLKVWLGTNKIGVGWLGEYVSYLCSLV